MKRLALLMVMSLIVTMGIAANNKKKAQQPLKPMNEFVSELMGKMTVQEKIGQLNLLPSGDIQTGISDNSSVSEAIRQGRLGAILNLKGVDNILKVQKMAVEESRLGIPLIFGMDVIHGYETIFPIPLALACSWDIPAIEQSARIAAKEATADGLCWTYSPMVDISIDPRWGRRVLAKTRSWVHASPRLWCGVIRAISRAVIRSWPALSIMPSTVDQRLDAIITRLT